MFTQYETSISISICLGMMKLIIFYQYLHFQFFLSKNQHVMFVFLASNVVFRQLFPLTSLC